MTVFISWSGISSKEIAEILKDWLPNVIQKIEPWLSTENIDKGSIWNTHILKELNKCFFGIICLTKENINAPWLLFEAGALSKSIDISRVCPFLFRIKPTDITGPLAQFQSTIIEKGDKLKLIKSINNAMGNDGLEENKLEKAFNIWWPEFENRIAKITPEDSLGENKKRTDRDILEEILTISREQAKQNNPMWSKYYLGENSFPFMMAPNPAGSFIYTVKAHPNESYLESSTDKLCPCGSGLKYSECHGKPIESKKPDN
jgi:hypothetical protein